MESSFARGKNLSPSKQNYLKKACLIYVYWTNHDSKISNRKVGKCQYEESMMSDIEINIDNSEIFQKCSFDDVLLRRQTLPWFSEIYHGYYDKRLITTKGWNHSGFDEIKARQYFIKSLHTENNVTLVSERYSVRIIWPCECKPNWLG